jgi:cellobiose phosphorylase
MNMINPVNHARDAAETGVYKVEPYVMAADVYKVSTHLGRGGWTWYTGSAGWMYQAMVRSVLGIVVAGNKLDFNPCMQAEWSNVKIDYRLAGSVYHIELLTGAYGAVSVSLDGTGQPDGTIVLLNDGKDHVVTVKIPAKTEHVAAAHEI